MGVKMEAFQDGRCGRVDGAAFAFTDFPTGPIDQFQIVGEGEANTVGVRVMALWDQSHQRDGVDGNLICLLCLLRCHVAYALLDGGEVGGFRGVGHLGTYRVEVHIAHAGQYGGIIE
ncbi:hypothetical protein ECTPHS_07661 [Ectothiorhodospira sp. PHS-1]|nr:hypothetical protein ECTPHS_07661 [Ectothiorhodospira sp. PHS-1]